MKILRKGDDFKKVKDSSFEDLKKLNSLIGDGWNYSPKKDYKEAVGKANVKDEKKEKVEKVDKKMDKDIDKKRAEKKKVEKKTDKKKKK